MSFEELDKKIIDAAGNHQPAFREDAWQLMEKKLDAEMPREKDKRRRGFLWFFLCFVVGSTAFITFAIRHPEGQLADDTNENTTTKGALLPAIEGSAERIQPDQSSAQKEAIGQNTIPFIGAKNKDTKMHSNIPDVQTGQYRATSSSSRDGSSSIIRNSSLPEERSATGVAEQFLNEKSAGLPFRNSILLQSGKKFPGIQLTEHTNTAVVLPPIRINKQSMHGFSNRFSLYITTGPSLSATSIDKPGKLTMAYGGGLAYQLSHKLRISSGFMIAKKVYTAAASDYHPPAGYWTYNYDLLHVDADCKIYEVPLALQYTLTDRQKHTFFLSAGLSSYFMKSETYNYAYKDLAGQPRYRGWTLKNGKQHYFSILALGGGYEKKLSTRTSFIIQPMVKIPLKGIGFGNIKLADAGTLFTLQVKPFASK